MYYWLQIAPDRACAPSFCPSSTPTTTRGGATFNAFNDDYYAQVWHQLLFSTTELASTVCVVHMADARNNIKPGMVLFVMRQAVLLYGCGCAKYFFF